MKIYRGPKSQNFEHTYSETIKMAGDENHKFVDKVDLSNDTGSWSGEKSIAVNVTKEGSERRAVVHIVIEEADIIALHQGLMKGLQRKRELWEEAYSIFNSAMLSFDLNEKEFIGKIHSLMEKSRE